MVPTKAKTQVLNATERPIEMVDDVVDGKLGLGNYQNVILLEVDGPKEHMIHCKGIAIAERIYQGGRGRHDRK